MSARLVVALACCLASGACEKKQPPTSEGVATPAAPAAEAPAREPGELLEPGDPAPDVQLLAHTGQAVRISELRGSPVVVYFYPKDATPGCTVQAREVRDQWKSFKRAGAHVFGISTDDNVSHRAFASAEELPFLLVSDADQKVARAFGVPVVNGKAKRITFLIDENGKIAKVFDDVRPEGSASELLSALGAEKAGEP